MTWKKCLGPGFVSISPRSIIIRETSQIHTSKFYVIRKYVILLIYDLIINALSLISLTIRKQNPNKNEIKIIVSNLVKQNLRDMDAYDGATIESQIELLKKTRNSS